MKQKKILGLVLCLLLLLFVVSCATTERGREVYLYNDNSVVVSFRNASDKAIQAFISGTRNDKSMAAARKAVSAESRATYSVEQDTRLRLDSSIRENLYEALREDGFEMVRVDEARFILEGNVDISYGRTAKGETWFYDVYLTAWDREHVPLDYNRGDLVQHQDALRRTTDIDTLDPWADMSWSTHGEIYASDEKEAEKLLLEQLDKEIRQSFVGQFFQI